MSLLPLTTKLNIEQRSLILLVWGPRATILVWFGVVESAVGRDALPEPAAPGHKSYSIILNHPLLTSRCVILTNHGQLTNAFNDGEFKHRIIGT